MTNARGKPRRPRERLHATEASAHHRRPPLDAQPIGKARLRVDPILDGNERKFRAVRLSSRRVDRLRTGRAEATPQVVDADDEKPIGVERLARTDHVVPPADVARLVGVIAGDVMRRVERVGDEHGVAALAVQRTVRFVGELVVR